MIKTFNEFAKDYQEYYHVEHFEIRTLNQMEDVVDDLYGLFNVDIDYKNSIIEIW